MRSGGPNRGLTKSKSDSGRSAKEKTIMKARPRTIASRKRIARRKAERRAGNKPALGIPPKGKGWVGKKAKTP
jgi:hypothetical protein